MDKLVGYLRYFFGGITDNAKNGNALKFIAAEAKTKYWRAKNLELRKKFDSALKTDYAPYSPPTTLDNVRVFSFCHGGGTPEQKLSILSFLRHVGVPATWSIVSDGSITKSQAESLRSLHPSIEILDWRMFICDENRECCDILSQYTLFSKKLALESNLPVQGATVYTDSDVLFFGGGHRLRVLLNNLGEETYYQRDLPGYLDPSFLTENELKAPPLNAGFVIQGKRLDWSVPLARLKAELARLTPAQKSYDLEKLEQATAHAAHFLAGSRPLDEQYVLQISDRLDERDLFSGPEFIMRHYVRTVRHKMWMHASEYLR